MNVMLAFVVCNNGNKLYDISQLPTCDNSNSSNNNNHIGKRQHFVATSTLKNDDKITTRHHFARQSSFILLKNLTTTTTTKWQTLYNKIVKQNEKKRALIETNQPGFNRAHGDTCIPTHMHTYASVQLYIYISFRLTHNVTLTGCSSGNVTKKKPVSM